MLALASTGVFELANVKYKYEYLMPSAKQAIQFEMQRLEGEGSSITVQAAYDQAEMVFKEFVQTVNGKPVVFDELPVYVAMGISNAILRARLVGKA